MPVANRPSEALQRTIAFFESIEPASLSRIDEIYAPQASFRDPFNEVQGLPGVARVFADMFERTHAPRFVITGAVEQASEAFVTWDFEFGLSPGGRRLQVQGCSHLRFDGQGRLVLHRDYWDAAGELYEKLPVLGVLMRALRRRLSAA
jgi:hypothetical protein